MNVDSLFPDNRPMKSTFRKFGTLLFVAVVGALAALTIAHSMEFKGTGVYAQMTAPSSFASSSGDCFGLVGTWSKRLDNGAQTL